MSTNSNFNDDVSLAQNVSKFLNQKIYPKLGFVREYKAYEWNKYEKEQMNGVDVDMTVSTGYRYRVDEKGAFYYMQPEGKLGAVLPTFSFELGYVKDGKIRTGWFVDESKVTNAYLLMWASATDRFIEMKKYNKNELKLRLKEFNPWKDFREIEFMLVSRFAMKNFLQTCGIRFGELEAFAQYIISHSSKYTKNSIPFIEFENFEAAKGVKMNIWPVFRNNVHFSFSKDNYAEQPVNLIVRKTFMDKRFARQHFFVKPDAQGSWDNYEVKAY